MEYGKLLNSLPDTLKTKYRNYESFIKKYINAEWSKLFNSVCLDEVITKAHKFLSIDIKNTLLLN